MELQRDIPLVRGDRVELQQVLINLLINGMEAMSLNTHRPRSLTIHSRRVSSGEVVVAVRDCGPGFGPDQRDRIFDPFFTTKPNGMGMGLAISRSIIEAHGGSLWATSSEAGATFQLALPSVP
jgi:C4-dicarboxylate-specific signal transduction histidine kinase